MSKQMQSDNKKEINYQALRDRTRLAKVTLWIGIVCSAIFLGCLALMLVSVLATSGQSEGAMESGDTLIASVFMVFFFGSLGVMLISAIVYGILEYIRSKARFERFLADNNWHRNKEITTDSIAMSVVGVAGAQSIVEGVGGEYKGEAFKMFFTAISKYETVLNVQIELRQQFPLLILEEKDKNPFNRVIGAKSPVVPDGRLLNLEGDFSERFRLTVVEGTERDALHVFTPDFMHELFDKPKGTSFELANNHLFITCLSNPSYSEKNLQKVFTTADIVLKHLGEMEFAWQASSSDEEMSDMSATVNRTRHRLLRRNFIISIAVTVGIIAGYIVLQVLSLASGG